MVVGFVTAGILILAIAGFVYLCITHKGNKTANYIAIALLLLALVSVPGSFHSVNTGEIAVVKQFGKIVDVREAGLKFDWWFLRKYQIYDKKVQNVEIETMSYSSDAQTMDIALTMQYTIMADKVEDIATKYGNLETLESRLQSVAIARTKAVMSKNKAMDIIANRAALSVDVEKDIKSAIDEEYYVNITTVVLTNIDFSDAFEKAVEDKMIAEQNKLKADYTNDTKVATAEANAKAEIIEAEAHAKANKIIQDSLTDKVLESKFYEKWDGVLPNVMGDNAVITDITGKTKDTD